ncbi:MAG: exopolysaccharide biosynthesis polyprenyl glycosylphosphotransferase, partial [Syntrophomonas sp.]
VMVDGVAYCILGGFNDAIKVITDNNIRNIILALPSKPGPELVGLTNKLKAYTHSILVLPDLIGISVTDSQITHFSNDQIVAYSTCNNLANPVNLLIKNLFDRIMGIIIFVIILPLLAFLTLIVKLDSPGPAIYSGNRIGRLGKEFRCYKFRTMYLNNDEILKDYFSKNPWEMDDWYKYAKLRGDDPRVTRVGKWLRKLSLDELPQIFNVLGGEMSLVGARPYLPREKGQMGKDADTILIAKPGITGLWQVSGRNEIDFRGRIDLETWYVRNWSMWFDITLLIRTVGVVLGRKGAY